LYFRHQNHKQKQGEMLLFFEFYHFGIIGSSKRAQTSKQRKKRANRQTNDLHFDRLLGMSRSIEAVVA
jgi:hypothetical protein